MALLHPITLRRLKCFCKRTHTYLPTDSCYAIRCAGLPPPNSTNTLPSKPRSTKKDTYAPTFHKPYAALIIETSHHALPSHSKHIFCTVEFCTVDCAQSNLPIRWSTLHLDTHRLPRPAYRTAQPPQTHTHAYHAELSQSQNMFCTVSHRQLQSIQSPCPMKYPLPKPAYRTVQPPQTQTPTERTRGESIPTVSHLPHGT